MSEFNINGVMALDPTVKHVIVRITNYRVDIKVIRNKEPGQNILICEPEHIKRFVAQDVAYFESQRDSIYEQIQNAHKGFADKFMNRLDMPMVMNLDAYRKARQFMEHMEIYVERLYDMPYIIWACANYKDRG